MQIARKTTTFALVMGLFTLAMGLVFVLSRVAIAQDTAPSDDKITPILEDGNFDCSTLNADNSTYPTITSDFGFKIDANPTGGTYNFISGTQNGDATLLTGGAPADDSNSVELTPTLSNSDGETTEFDWMATISVDAVIVKAKDSNVYVYSPEDFDDGGLQAPELKGISHVEFCYDYELTASKDADAQFTRTYDWTIDKTVDDDTHTGFAGDTFTSNYDVIVDQTVTDSDFAVSGSIIVKNPSPLPVSFNVSDKVGETPATVNCPMNSLAPNDGEDGGSDEVKCTYSASLGNTKPSDGTNTATITSNTAGVSGATASADYAFGDPTTVVGDPEINVTDTYNGNLGSTSGDQIFEYSRDFSCSSNPEDYTNGVDSDTYPNTATISGTNTNKSADASVKVDCTLQGRGTVKKTTNGVVDPTKSIDFTLTGSGLPSGGVTKNTLGDSDGVLDFGYSLVPGSQYTVCENPVPAGFTSFWKLDGTIVTPYNPGASKSPPEDIGVRCYVFSASAGQTRSFEIDNSHPGGDPRTIGYWKNWNKCTSGNQAATAAKNGGAVAKFFIVEDLLPQTLSTGDANTSDDYKVTSCAQAVKILSKQNQSGKNMASDAAYELASQLLAAKFNLAAGAETCSAVQTAVTKGQLLLDQINFNGSGSYLTKTSANKTNAISLAATLDKYNNGNVC